MHGRRTNGLGVFVFFVVAVFLFVLASFNVGESLDAEGTHLAKKNLAEDIQLLGEWLHRDLSPYGAPRDIIVFTKDEFLSYFEEQKRAGHLEKNVPVTGYAAFFESPTNTIYINAQYRENAIAIGASPEEMFFMYRFHELYHWALCALYGRYRHHRDNDPDKELIKGAIDMEENNARQIGYQYVRYHRRKGEIAP